MLSSVVAAVGFTPLTATAQAQTAAPQASSEQGAGAAAAPFVRRLDTTPQMTMGEQHPQPLAPLKGVDPATFALRKARAAQSPADPKAASPPPARLQSLPTPGQTVLFNSTDEVGCGDVTPADQAIAVGDTPVGVLQVINVCVNVFDKLGNLQAGYPKSLTSFVGLPAFTPVSDPRAIYDWVNHRYFVTFIQFDPNFASASFYWIAVSRGDNPAGAYCLYKLGVQSVGVSGGFFPLPDFPRLGQDTQAIYLASNIFNPDFKWEEILVLPKAALEACTGTGFSVFFDLALGGVATDTTQPANVFEVADNPRSEYLVTSKNIFFADPKNGLVVWAIHSPLSSPTLTGVFVATANSYSLPPKASQPGGANDVDTGDTRISGMAMYNAGSIYASLNAANGTHSEAILYQIQPFVTAGGANDGKIASARILNEFVHGGAFDTYYATQQPDPEAMSPMCGTSPAQLPSPRLFIRRGARRRASARSPTGASLRSAERDFTTRASAPLPSGGATIPPQRRPA
ncbi:MAG: hypothetical protein ACREC0_01670 [Methylocella sp.]